MALVPPSGPYTTVPVLLWCSTGAREIIVIFGPVRHHGPITISLGNFSKFPKGKPFYIENTVGKTSKSEQIHSDVNCQNQIPLVVAPWLPPPTVICIDGLKLCQTTWNKPKFLAFLVGVTKWMPVTPPPQDGKHLPKPT